MNAVTGVVIVNFNAGEALSRCVESVLSQHETTRILLADNASTDRSAETVQAQYGQLDTVEVHLNGENLGFARAVNRAAASAHIESADWLLILNPDCELFPGALAALREALERNPSHGLAGPMVVDRHGEPLRGTYRRFPDPWRSLLTFTGLWRLGRFLPLFEGIEPVATLPETITHAEAVSGACMLLPRQLFLEAGGFDEGYGLHCEDLDWCMRFRAHGWKIYFVPDARVTHFLGVCGRTRPVFVEWHKHKGMIRFYRKFFRHQYPGVLMWLVSLGVWLRFAATAVYHTVTGLAGRLRRNRDRA